MDSVSDRPQPSRLTSLRIAGALLLLMVLPSMLLGQVGNLSQSWRWTEFTTESGLPAGRVYDIVETDAGVAWAATDSGVAWYDGFTWSSVQLSNDIRPSRPTSFYVNERGALVVVSESRLFEGNTYGFQEIPVEVGGSPLLLQEAVPLGEGNLVLRARDPRTQAATIYLLRNGAVQRMDAPAPLGGGTARAFWMTRGGRVWLHTQNSLYYWADTRWVLKIGGLGESATISHVSGAAAEVGILGISYPREARGVWEWENGGTPRFNTGEGQNMLAAVDLAPSGDALAVHETGHVRSRRSGTWSPVEGVPELQDVLFLKFRANGDLWVGTRGGLFLYRAVSDRWATWAHPFPDLRNRVSEIIRTRDGDIWVGTSVGVEIHRPDGTVEWIDRVNGRPLGLVTGMAEDSEGRVWVSSGADFNGAYRWDGEAWRQFGPRDGLHAPRVHRIASDRQGRLWFLGLSDRPVNDGPGAFVLEDGAFTRWGMEEGLLNGRTYAFAQGVDSAFWFGNHSGLSRWRDGEWTHWTSNELVETRIYSLAAGNDGRIWFGDRANGLGMVDLDDEVSYLTTDDGLVDDRVQDLDIGADGRLWISTLGGLSSYSDGVFANFDYSLGLANPSLWPVMATEHRVYLGTHGGGVAILSMREALQPGNRVRIGDLLVHGSDVYLSWIAAAYWGTVASADIETRYRIDDGQWEPWSRSHEALLSGLSSGAHTVQIEPKCLFGLCETENVSATFTVPPPMMLRPMVALPLGFLSAALVILVTLAARRKRIDAAARNESEQRFRALVENASDVFTVIAEDGTIEYQGPSVTRVAGFDPSERVGRSVYEQIHPDDRERAAEVYASAFSNPDAVGQMVVRANHRDGTELILEITVSGIRSATGKPLCVAVSRDMTQRVLAENKLRKSEEHFRSLIENALDIITIVDEVGTITYNSPSVERSLGYGRDELVGTSLVELVHPEDRGPVSRLLAEAFADPGKPRVTQTRVRHKDQSWRTFESIGSSMEAPNGMVLGVVNSRDITDMKSLEAQMHHAQKMEAVGLLAGGVAHDFNNLLTVIGGYASLLQEDLTPDRLKQGLEEIEKAHGRAVNLTRQLLAFGRKQIMRPRTFRLGECVSEVEPMLRRLIGAHFELIVEAPAGGDNVRADEGQIEQVVMNLVVNACDAMPEGGQIKVDIECVHYDTPIVTGGSTIQPGAYVTLSVSDAGCGMDEKTQSRIFEPFFTTKPAERGTGLGLSTVFGIVQQSGGQISVQSSVGVGTTFKVLLPQEEAHEEPISTAVPDDQEMGGDETILVADDDESVRDLVGSILGRNGYAVIEAENGNAALQMAAEHDGDIDLVLTDVVMPGMSGAELGARLCEGRPGTPILFMSGYAGRSIKELDPSDPFISKPFTPGELLRMVAEVLRESRTQER